MEYLYAALLLHKTNQPITEENLEAVLKAAKVSIDNAKLKVVAQALKDIDINKTLQEAQASLAVSIAAPAQSAQPAQAQTQKQEKKDEGKAEAEAAAGLGALFG